MLKVHLIRSADVDPGFLEDVHALLGLVEGPVQFVLEPSGYPFAEGKFPWEDFFSVCDEFRYENAIAPDSMVLLVTTRRNTANWFSVSRRDGTGVKAFICSSDWEHFIASPPKYAVSYLIVANAFRLFMFKDEDELLESAHEPSIGCLNDMNAWKPDILYKFRTADICRDCYDRLLENGTPESVIEQLVGLLEEFRRGMLFRPPSHVSRGLPGAPGLPFQVAITKRKLQSAGDPLHRFNLMLDHFDSILRSLVICVGRIVHGGRFVEFIEEQGLSGRVSLGNWVEALHALCRAIRQEDDSRILPQGSLGALQKIAASIEENRIVRMRNDDVHGYTPTGGGEDYRDRCLKFGPIVGEIERLASSVLHRVELRYVRSSERVAEDAFEVSYLALTGDNPLFLEHRIRLRMTTMDEIPIRERVYLVENDSWHDLRGAIRYEACPQCRHERVLIMDGQLYLDPYAGHRVQLPPN